MTIKEFAKQQSISPQAVYQRLKAAGIPIDSIREGKTSELTPDGLEKLSSLFLKPVENSAKEETVSINQFKALQLENEFLKNRIEELTADRDRWAAQAEAAQQTAQQAQALNMANLKALPAPRQSIWERITGRRNKEQS
ncbi:MAG: hypothetical protein ACI4Q4_04165 [Oscillospiraceae bacterium]